jgi:16S rRNA (cytidine1402-2'-O)-methyltransferase
VVARELTKIHEEFRNGTLDEVAEYYREQQVKGEIVILVAPPVDDGRMQIADVVPLLRQLLAERRISFKDAVMQAAQQTGVSRSELYEMALRLKLEAKSSG